ncbi:MAG: mismatch-specific DNA-glycosylase [Patescibacteria group bacterium]|jgi:TDG/mug DNA glycosylase family protein
MKTGLPDLISDNLGVVFCGMAAGKYSCEAQHYYANPRNNFWRILYEIKFTDKQLLPSADPLERSFNYQYLKDKGIGLTDLVKDGCGMDNEVVVGPLDIKRLDNLIKEFQPSILAFNGKKVAKIFFNKNRVDFGLQDYKIGKTQFFVLPSTSQVAARWWNQSFWQEACGLIKKVTK